MKKLNVLFTALLLLCCLATAKAEEVTIDGIRYDVITKAKIATVIKKETGEYSGEIVIPETIVHNNVTCNVTSIGDRAFSDCYDLTSVVIPTSVTGIGYDAFWCCIGLTSITIPNSVSYIGSSAFGACSSLTRIVIPNSVTNIDDGVFWACSGLTCVEIPNSVTSIGNGAFNGCSGLTSIEIPNSVISIGESAFEACSSLTSIEIPNSVISIGDFAFYECSGLTSAVIGNSVTCIGDKAFYYCDGLTSVTIPNSVISIGNEAFYGCSGLTSAVIGNSVTSIGDKAFYYCSGLTSIEIPNSVTYIGGGAFEGCDGFTSIVIPNSVTWIGYSAFSHCDGLTSVTIGSGVNYIQSNAFADCDNLADVYCLATTVPTTYSDAFEDSYPKFLTLHVPAKALDSYKATVPWSSFGTIVAIDGKTPETPGMPKCANPVISYRNGELVIECETPNAEFVTKITSNDFNSFYSNTIALTGTYNISVYATATGYNNSDTVNATLCWIECDCSGNNTTGVINVPAKAVLFTSANGAVTVNCSLEGEIVTVYTTDGTTIGTAVIANGSATIQSGLSKGSVAVVKIGDKSVKVVVD